MGLTTSAYRCGASLALAAGLILHGAAQAQTTVYKCVDGQGRIEFTDTVKPGCKALDLPGFIPAAAPSAMAPPASFPRVDSVQQRARDDDRREILNDELRIEEKKLAGLKRDFNNGEPERQGNERNYAKYQERVSNMRDEINRTEHNIEALRREIATIR